MVSRETATFGSTQAITALAALAQETRLAIFRLLIEHAGSGLTPGAMTAELSLPPATLSFHLKELARAGLIEDRRAGRHLWYRPNLAAMNTLVAYLNENCCRAEPAGDACVTPCAPSACTPSTARRRRR